VPAWLYRLYLHLSRFPYLCQLLVARDSGVDVLRHAVERSIAEACEVCLEGLVFGVNLNWSKLGSNSLLETVGEQTTNTQVQIRPGHHCALTKLSLCGCQHAQAQV
jgi:hypothetical protein